MKTLILSTLIVKSLAGAPSCSYLKTHHVNTIKIADSRGVVTDTWSVAEFCDGESED